MEKKKFKGERNVRDWSGSNNSSTAEISRLKQ